MRVDFGMESKAVDASAPANRSLMWATLGLTLFYLSIGLALRYPVNEAKIPVSGDEQHYLTQAFSLLSDGDLVVLNNYERSDYLTFYINELDPTLWNLIGDNGYSAHSPGAGVAVAPGFWVAGWVGVLVTLAAAMGATFAITAATLARLTSGPLPDGALLLLVAGFAVLPLLAYSHTLYPETFMALVIATLALLTVTYLQSPSPRGRTTAALLAISVTALSIAFHPKYFVVLIGVTLFLAFLDLYDARKNHIGAGVKGALSYIVVAGIWLAFFSWMHKIMWGDFNPAGWFMSIRDSLGVSPGRTAVQFVDLFFGRENGLFFLVPIALVSLAYLLMAFRRGTSSLNRRLGLLVVILVGSIVVPAAHSSAWSGGDSPLGRYASPLVPILLLVGVYQIANLPWSMGRRVYLWVVVGLGAVHALTYIALPMLFRPQPDGRSATIVAISSRLDGIAWADSRLWSANNPFSWVGILLWIAVLAATFWLFARPEGRL